MSEQVALVALLRTLKRGETRRSITEELLERGSARALWEDRQEPGLFGADAAAATLAQASNDVKAWLSAGWKFLTILDADYPARVREIHEAPPFLFAQGTLRPDDGGVAIVGSRKASPRGLMIAETLATALTHQGVTIVSGLAKGIDGAAHAAALAHKGRTVAVIGTGLSTAYPAEHAQLQARIADDGLVLSQFWPDAPPRSQNFPQRNAIMSGYSHVTVVVEAGEHSGARIQARLAVSHGRPVILTDLVVDQTKWGRALQGRPGVVVARDLDAALIAVKDVLEREKHNKELLGRISGRLL